MGIAVDFSKAAARGPAYLADAYSRFCEQPRGAGAGPVLPLLFVLGQQTGLGAAFANTDWPGQPMAWVPEVVHTAGAGQWPLPVGHRRGASAAWTEHQLDSPHEWSARVAGVTQAIAVCKVEKAVVSRRVTMTRPQAASAMPMLQGLRATAGTRTIFAISVDGGANCFCGATPETLLRVENGQLTVDAVAGTLPAGAGCEDFRGHDRLWREHLVVVRGLVKVLAQAIGLPVVHAPDVVQSGTVAHLRTRLTGRLTSSLAALPLIARLHPTAAICGWPVEAAKALVARLEGYDRGWFAAPLGWLDAAGNAHAVVAIRSCWVGCNQAGALAGAGIVAGADADSEWLETERKLDNVRRALRGMYDG